MTFTRPHTWPEGVDPPVGFPVECKVCRYTLGPNVEPRPLCPGESANSTGLERRKPLRRTGTLDRSKGLSPVSPTNSGREHQKDEAYRDYVRSLPCAACSDPPPSDPAHVRSRGAGYGDWIERDGEQVGNLVSLCRPCHRLQHDRGIETFQQITDVDLAAKARRTGQAFREQGA